MIPMVLPPPMPVVITAPVHLIDYPVKVGAVARAPPGPGGVEPGEMRRRTIPTAATKIARISLSFFSLESADRALPYLASSDRVLRS